MSKQLKPNEWIYFFNLYEEDYFQWRIEYRISREKLTKSTITIFTTKMKNTVKLKRRKIDSTNLPKKDINKTIK